MGRIWAILFLLVPVLGVACFAIGPPLRLWFPDDFSADGYKIDHLFYFILYLTGVVFVATEATLFYFMWKYNRQNNTQPVKFTHGSHTLEVVWTILPAATLLFIAIYQINVWADAKFESRMASTVAAEVTGRQFEWRMRYPGADGQLHTPDDLFDVNDLHVPVDEEIVLIIKSDDVLHSFFLPNFRVKQDVVPGMTQKVHFRAKPGTEGKYDIVCAELCGWGHYKMKGRITIDSPTKYREYLAKLEQERTRSTDPAPGATQTAGN